MSDRNVVDLAFLLNLNEKDRITARNKVRNRIIEINNTCADITREATYVDLCCCHSCPNDNACTFLLAFEEWWHIKPGQIVSGEDLERLVNSVMTIEDYEDLLKPNEEV